MGYFGENPFFEFPLFGKRAMEAIVTLNIYPKLQHRALNF